jgi:type IV secretion system protein VirD4
MKKNFSKLLALYLPYLLLGLAATNFGEAWRLAEGKEMGDKILSLMSTIPAAFANPLPSLHPLDILVGICCGAGLRLAVYLKSKNEFRKITENLLTKSIPKAPDTVHALVLRSSSTYLN